MYVVATAQKELTYPDLVRRLYDMEYVATPPRSGEQSGNFSSYDRRSVYHPGKGTYMNWDANRDGSGFIRKEGEGRVIFEMEGPGVIWRCWSALALEGNILVYIDHSPDPVIATSFRDFFEKFDTLVPIINLPNLAMTLSRGRNRWMPVPYNRHCKIVLEEGWGAYYHLTYTTFPEGTVLPVFTGHYDREDAIALAKADRLLESRGYRRKDYPNEQRVTKDITAEPGSGKMVSTIQGNRAITHFKIRYNENKVASNEDRQQMIKNLWIQITWDDDPEPSVMAPLGMFFGTFPDIYPFRTLPVGALPGYFYSNWFMPFSEKARVEILNRGEKTLQCAMEIIHAPLDRPGNELLRFHAKWHRGRFKEEVQTGGREIDWPLLIAKGRGRYCGVTLHIQNEWEIPEEDPETWWYGAWDRKTIDWWWGEGDEKFYVDGEKFPSTYGTGSEDYIGYAWSAEPPFSLFDSPFAAQPFTPLDGNGHTNVSRFHIADNIPFQQSFTGVIEKYKGDAWGENNICRYQAVSYFYLSAGESDEY
jgi:hypothetical protein